MQRREDIYYKQRHDETEILLSGLHLPDPDTGPFEFIRCDFHPRLWETLYHEYHTSTFVRCNYSHLVHD